MTKLLLFLFNIWRPRYLYALLLFSLVYAVAYIFTYVDLFDNAPDIHEIDTSEAHQRELIEWYKKQRGVQHLDKFKTKKQDQPGQDNKTRILKNGQKKMRNKEGFKSKDVVNTLGGSRHHLKGNTRTDDLDPDLADIFYDINVNGAQNNEPNIQHNDDGRSNIKEDEVEENIGEKKNQKVVKLKQDKDGNVLVNAALLLEYEDKIANRPKILPKKTIKYKVWEGAFYTEPYLLSKPMGKIDFECLDLMVEPSTPICLYKSEEDVYVSAELRYNGVWEPHIVDQIQRALNKDKELGLIDLGANLGQYSLIAAKMGRKVLAIEPYSQTLKRFRKAAQMGDLISNIRVLKNAVTDVRTSMYIHLNPDNMGDARVNTDNSTCKQNCEVVNSILMSDIVPYLNFKKAILKIDIQGFENVIFYYADHLLNNVFIPYIFMEWALLREHYVHEDHKSPEKRDVDYTIMYMITRGYTAYSSIDGKRLNLDYWGGWPADVFWVLKWSDQKIFNPKAVKPLQVFT